MKRNTRISLGMTLLTATFMSGAIWLAPQAMAAPGDYATYSEAYNAGRDATIAGEWIKARPGWESAIKQAQGSQQRAAAMLGLAHVAMEQKQLDEAIGLCQEVLAIPEKLPQMASAHYFLSRIYLQQGNKKEAVQQWRELKILVPDWTGPEPGATITEADITQMIYGPLVGDVKGKTMDQIGVLLELLVKDPKTPAFKQATALMRLGEMAMKAARADLARDYFTRSLAAMPAGLGFTVDRALIEDQLGDACAAEDDWTAARQAYERALPDIDRIMKESVKAKRDTAARNETPKA